MDEIQDEIHEPYLREITAKMFWKIVFSFSAEFLKSGGDTGIRKKMGRLCHKAWYQKRWNRTGVLSLEESKEE